MISNLKNLNLNLHFFISYFWNSSLFCIQLRKKMNFICFLFLDSTYCKTSNDPESLLERHLWGTPWAQYGCASYVLIFLSISLAILSLNSKHAFVGMEKISFKFVRKLVMVSSRKWKKLNLGSKSQDDKSKGKVKWKVF